MNIVWFVGILAAITAGSIVFLGEDAPDVGLLSPVYARPAERVEVRTLSQGETVGEILLTAMDANDQYALLLALREQASPRRMRPGTEVSFRWATRPDVEAEALRAVDITLNKDETVRLRRTPGGWDSSIMLTPVQADTVFASGEINGSLWNSMVGDDDLAVLDPADRAELIVELFEIYEFQIEFEREIRDGDYWRVVYEREARPDGSTKIGRILSAELVNRRRSFMAVRFDREEDKLPAYFDLEGESLRSMFLPNPIGVQARLTSQFTTARFHPVLKRWRAHKGVDFGGVGVGAPIRASANGTITRREWSDSYGNWIEIRHAMGFSTRYAHMVRFESGLGVGSAVAQGEVIGYTGATGMVTGPHLHYELHRNGQAVDPRANAPAGEPVPASQMADWTAQRDSRFGLLDERVPRPWEVELNLEVRSSNATTQEGSD